LPPQKSGEEQAGAREGRRLLLVVQQVNALHLANNIKYNHGLSIVFNSHAILISGSNRASQVQRVLGYERSLER
jgi:hypothetical protein